MAENASECDHDQVLLCVRCCCFVCADTHWRVIRLFMVSVPLLKCTYHKWWLIFICSNIYLFADLLKYRFASQHSTTHTHKINWICFISENELCVPSSWEPISKPNYKIGMSIHEPFAFHRFAQSRNQNGGEEGKKRRYPDYISVASFGYILLALSDTIATVRLCTYYGYWISVASFFIFIFRMLLPLCLQPIFRRDSTNELYVLILA